MYRTFFHKISLEREMQCKKHEILKIKLSTLIKLLESKKDRNNKIQELLQYIFDGFFEGGTIQRNSNLIWRPSSQSLSWAELRSSWFVFNFVSKSVKSWKSFLSSGDYWSLASRCVPRTSTPKDTSVCPLLLWPPCFCVYVIFSKL